MFSMWRSFNGYALPVSALPVDSIQTRYDFEDITIQASDADDTLDIVGVDGAFTFNGEVFPLSGAAYLTATTGTLSVMITTALPHGLYRIPFVSSNSVLPIAGFALHGWPGFGIAGKTFMPIAAALLIQSLTIPGVNVSGTTEPKIVPMRYP
jgi:hypothetical protein